MNAVQLFLIALEGRWNRANMAAINDRPHMSRLIIEADHAESAYWSDLWRYRELFFFLSWRDILVRYKQTTIGILWALIRPVLIIIIGTVVFGRLGGTFSD